MILECYVARFDANFLLACIMNKLNTSIFSVLKAKEKKYIYYGSGNRIN